MKFSVIWILLIGFTGLAQDRPFDAFVNGKPILDLRFRVEHVDQDNLRRDATATTLRTRLGYETAAYRGWTLLLEFENITALDDEAYNDTDNGILTRPVVADPEDTEVNRLQLTYAWSGRARVVAGRQRLILDNARFVGNVGWRQNEQTFDALTFQHDDWLGWRWRMSVLDNVNRIFGEHHSRLGDTRLHGGLVHAQNKPWQGLTVSLFAHVLAFRENEAASHRNLGFFARGQWPPQAAKAWVYEASWVDQRRFDDGADRIDADYLAGSLGYRFGPWRTSLHLERLGGDGQYGFATPLATLHAFNGWADVFLNTPTAGLEDRFLRCQYGHNAWQVAVLYHDFAADTGGADFGSEWNLSVSRTIGEHVKAMLKAADYRAETFASDRAKLWLQVECRW